jgi:hypothetical protein
MMDHKLAYDEQITKFIFLVIFNLEDVHCAYGEYMLNSEIVDQNQKF